MKKIHIVGKDPEKAEKMRAQLAEHGLEYVESDPDLVISYGGDGIFLIAERIFPGVPKILIRDSEIGNKAQDLDACQIVKLYLEGKYDVQEINKLKAVCRGRFEFRSLVGLNDVVIRNSLPTEAIRFKYRINGGDWGDVLIGDGLVISAAYGSSRGAYFYSIVQKSFEEGIGVAFNNTTKAHDPLFLSSGDEIEIEITRGVGIMVSDNNRDSINLECGDKIVINQIDDVARRMVLRDGDIKN